METQLMEARRLRVAMALQRGQHEAEMAKVWATVRRLEGQVVDLSGLHDRVDTLDDRVTEVLSAVPEEAPATVGVEADSDRGPQVVDDGGPARAPAVPALSLKRSAAGGRALDVLFGGSPHVAR